MSHQTNISDTLTLSLDAAVLKNKFNITNDELDLLKKFGEQHINDVEVFIDDFYVWMETQEEFHRFFINIETIHRVKRQQVNYWHEFFHADITPVFLKNRVHIGAIHAQIGLPIYSYCAAMSFSAEWWNNKINTSRANGELGKDKEAAATMAVQLAKILYKLVYLDTAIVTETYHQNTQIQLKDTLDATQKIVHDVTAIAEAVVKGDYSTKLIEDSNINIAINQMIDALNKSSVETGRDKWVKTGQAQLSEKLRGDQALVSLGANAVNFLTKYLKANVGVFYLINEHSKLRLIGSYAYQHRKNLSEEFEIGQGLVGQAVLEKQAIIIDTLPPDYLSISSGLGEAKAGHLLVYPILLENHVIGVMELGSFEPFDLLCLELLKGTNDMIASSIDSALNREKMNLLLEDSQKKSQELEEQSLKLETINKDLEEQSHKIKASEEELKTQSEELHLTNEALKEKTQALEAQKRDIEHQNEELGRSQKQLQEKARELLNSSKYKTEFLSNMSHELRTPLNSLLILSQTLIENDEHNLTDEQIEAARIINNSGKDLLNLINDILDLSKVEAGKLQLDLTYLNPYELASQLQTQLNPVAQKAQVHLTIKAAPETPKLIQSDAMRIQQILKNLLSNAIKFTKSQGHVSLSIRAVNDRDIKNNPTLSNQIGIAFEVHDDGIGISEEHQSSIFQAFQQADGTTSRKYGGTGLGLSISRQLAMLLGGDIQLKSKLNEGSTFTLYLPITAPEPEAHTEESNLIFTPPNNTSYTPKPMLQEKAKRTIPNQDLVQGKKILLVDDDMRNNIALGAYLRKHGFEVITADNGELALQRLSEKHGVDLVLMDIMMPIMDGYTTMKAIREQSEYSALPIIALTAKAMMEDREKCIQSGANDYLTKPVDIEKLLNTIYVWLVPPQH